MAVAYLVLVRWLASFVPDDSRFHIGPVEYVLSSRALGSFSVHILKSRFSQSSAFMHRSGQPQIFPERAGFTSCVYFTFAA